MKIIIFGLVNTKRPGRFCIFSKNWIKKFKLSISPQLRVPEKRTIARLKVLILGFHFGHVSPCRFLFLEILVSFSAARGLVVTTEYYWDLLRKNLLCKCMRLVFAMGQDFLRKLDFAKNGNL